MAELSEFGKAFASARAGGAKVFDFKGKKYTTQTREEALSESAAAPKPASVSADSGGDAVQSRSSGMPGMGMKKALDSEAPGPFTQAEIDMRTTFRPGQKIFSKAGEDFSRMGQAVMGAVGAKSASAATAEAGPSVKVVGSANTISLNADALDTPVASTRSGGVVDGVRDFFNRSDANLAEAVEANRSSLEPAAKAATGLALGIGAARALKSALPSAGMGQEMANIGRTMGIKTKVANKTAKRGTSKAAAFRDAAKGG